MREVLIVIAGILMVIFIMMYVAVEAHYKGWMECYNRMREIDEPYYHSLNAYIIALEQQVKNYERYVEVLGEKYEFEVTGNIHEIVEDGEEMNENE